ncbi:MAG: hypothetical protein AB7U73_15330 [Pirellulales bacterium]
MNQPATPSAPGPNDGRFTFTDRQGRTWDTTLTLLGARRVDNSDFSAIYPEPFSILRPNEKVWKALTSDDALIAAVIWAVVQPQVEGHAVADEEAFIDGFDGKTLAAAKEAFWGSLQDFFQGRGTALSTLIQAQKRAQQTILDRVTAEAETINQAVDQFVDEGMTHAIDDFKSALGKPSGGSSPQAA